TLSMVFGGTLSSGNQTTLNTVVANHIGYINNYTETGSTNGYVLDLYNSLATGGGKGLRVRAGEVDGDISIHIANNDDTVKIMEMEANQGFVIMGKTYAQTLTDNSIVYGVDNQHTAGTVRDFNTQNGVYRIGGVNVVDVAQTLTNKTITATSNNVNAKGLITATTTVNIGAATAPTSGQVLTATSGTSATWQTPPVFSSFFQQASSDAESTTTSTTFQQKVTLTTSSLVTGTYRIGWMYEWSYNNAGANFQGRVQLNNTLDLMIHVQEPKDAATSQFHQVGGFYYAVNISGVQTIDLDYSSSVNTSTARIRRARLDIWRVA
ncbi:MAG: hypothetical protein WD512_00205, partial [Candidatus Paceibacterota bacterium]